MDARACTKIACIPEKLCCNTCYANLTDIENPDYSIHVTGMDCAFQVTGNYFEGTLEKENGELSLVLPKPEDSSIYGCTLDAKVCDDGTVLGRQGPNCKFPKCPEEETGTNCEEGYTYTAVPYPTPNPIYYCKINKDWSEFSACNNSTACPENHSCVSQIDANPDFRCVPTESYLMDCGCNPGPNNEPLCWCT